MVCTPRIFLEGWGWDIQVVLIFIVLDAGLSFSVAFGMPTVAMQKAKVLVVQAKLIPYWMDAIDYRLEASLFNSFCSTQSPDANADSVRQVFSYSKSSCQLETLKIGDEQVDKVHIIQKSTCLTTDESTSKRITTMASQTPSTRLTSH